MKFINFFEKRRYMQTVFSLLSGFGYFMVVLSFVKHQTPYGGGFLSFMFCPAIVCGMALLILKTLKKFIDEKNVRGASFIVITHIIIITAGILFLIEMLILKG